MSVARDGTEIKPFIKRISVPSLADIPHDCINLCTWVYRVGGFDLKFHSNLCIHHSERKT